MRTTITLPIYYNEQDSGGYDSPDFIKFELVREDIEEAVENIRHSNLHAPRMIYTLKQFDMLESIDPLEYSIHKSTAWVTVYGDGEFIVRGGCNTDFFANWETEIQPSPLPCCIAHEGKEVRLVADIDYPWDDHEKPFLVCTICGDEYPSQYAGFFGIEIGE